MLFRRVYHGAWDIQRLGGMLMGHMEGFHFPMITLREKFPVSSNVGCARMLGMLRASSAVRGI